MNVGIDTLRVWPSTMAIDMPQLVEARGGNVREVVEQMLIDQRSVCPAWEDPVTMAVNAAQGLLDEDQRQTVGLLLVGSESGPDQEKALSTWVQRYLDLPDSCRNLEVKHACYAGTGSLQLAASWVAMQPNPDARALVINTDLSRQHFHRPYEFVMGCGAAAMVVKKDPRFLTLDTGLSGVYTHEVSDLTRPTSRVEAGHSETSLLSYLEAVDTTFLRYAEAVGAAGGPTLDDEATWRDWLPYLVYHAPFGGITLRAHKAVMRCFEGGSARAARLDFEDRVAPGLQFNRRMGGTYGSSVFVSLLGVADAFGEAVNGRRVGIYSYGSGSCAETWSGVFGPEASFIAEQAGLAMLLDARRALSVREYEEPERERSAFIDCGNYQTSLDGHDDWYQTAYAGRHLLTFRGVTDWVRQYAWS